MIALGCAGSPRFGKQGVGPNAFSLDTQTPDECGSLAEWSSMSKGWKTVYLLTDTFIDYTKTCSQYFETRWGRARRREDSVVGRDTFLLTDTSIASQVSRIRGLETGARVPVRAQAAIRDSPSRRGRSGQPASRRRS